MKRSFFYVMPLILAGSLFSGCASIVSKSQYPVNINSSPDQALITITNRKGDVVFKGKTPTDVTLKSGDGFFRKARYTIKLSKEGFEDQTVELSAKLDGWYFGNILFGGLIGILIVDPITGAMFKIDNQFVNATLSSGTANIDAPQLQILNYDQVPDLMKSRLVKLN